jgi:hypothetical protein
MLKPGGGGQVWEKMSDSWREKNHSKVLYWAKEPPQEEKEVSPETIRQVLSTRSISDSLYVQEKPDPKGRPLDVQPTMVPYLLLEFTHSYDPPTLSDSQDSLSVLIWAYGLTFSPPWRKRKKNENICNIMVENWQALVYREAILQSRRVRISSRSRVCPQVQGN